MTAQAQLVPKNHREETTMKKQGAGGAEEEIHFRNILSRGSPMDTSPPVDKQALVFCGFCLLSVYSKIVHLERQETDYLISRSNAVLQM